MKKALSLILALMLLVCCMNLTAFAEDTYRMYFFADETDADFIAFIDSQVAEAQSFWEDMLAHGGPDLEEMLAHIKQEHPTWYSDTNEFLTDVVRADLIENYKHPACVYIDYNGGDNDKQYPFVPVEGLEDRYYAELPAGLELKRGTLDGQADIHFTFGSSLLFDPEFAAGIAAQLPNTMDRDVWLQFKQSGWENWKAAITDTQPDNWLTETPNTTTITAEVPDHTLSYEMVIPEDVTITDFGITAVGAATVANVVNASSMTVISYTVEGTDFIKSDDSTKVMPASYYTDAEGTTALGTGAIVAYKDKAVSTSLTDIYIGVTEADWFAAAAGSYAATLTYTFTAAEVSGN